MEDIIQNFIKNPQNGNQSKKIKYIVDAVENDPENLDGKRKLFLFPSNPDGGLKKVRG